MQLNEEYRTLDLPSLERIVTYEPSGILIDLATKSGPLTNDS